MAANPGFPVTLDVKGYVVLVLGGDEEAAEKTQRLLDAGAKVIVISPTLHERLKQLAASAKVIHRGRHFRETDLESAIFVLNMIRGDRDFARSLFTKARERKFLLWSVDFPEASTVNMPAVVEAGHARVAISTSGMAPALSGFMKEDLERILDSEFMAFVDWLGQLREQAKSNEPDVEKRRTMLREALDGFRLLGKVQYPKVWLEKRVRNGRRRRLVAKTSRDSEERNRMVLLEFSMSPLGKGESVSKFVSRSLDIIDKSGVPYRLNPMGTVLEGEWDEVFAVVRQCYERMKKDCNRISCSIKVDYRKGHSGRLVSKVASVEKTLKRSIKQ